MQLAIPSLKHNTDYKLYLHACYTKADEVRLKRAHFIVMCHACSNLFSAAQNGLSALIVLQGAQNSPVAWFRIDIFPVFNPIL